MRAIGLALVAVTAVTILTFVVSGRASSWFFNLPWMTRIAFGVTMFGVVPGLGILLLHASK